MKSLNSASVIFLSLTSISSVGSRDVARRPDAEVVRFVWTISFEHIIPFLK